MTKLIMLLGLILIIGLIIDTTAYTTTEITAPPAGFTFTTSTSVNISGGINASGFPDLFVNGSIDAWIGVMIMNKSCQSCSYDNHSNYVIKASNGSTSVFWNQTITLGEGYNWIYLNFTNATVAVLPAHTVTEVRIINVDTEKYKLNVGGFNKINFTVDVGNISTAGNVRISGCIQLNCSQAGGCTTWGICV